MEVLKRICNDMNIKEARMAEFNITKMKDILKSKNYTYSDLAKITNFSKSSIEKVFGGFNTNPTMKFLQKIADALECSIDDFFERDEEPVSPYYLDRKTAELAESLKEQPDLKVLLDASRSLTPNDIKFVIDFVNKIKGNKNG